MLAITVTPKPTPYVTATLAFFVTKIHKNDETALQKPIIIAPTIDDQNGVNIRKTSSNINVAKLTAFEIPVIYDEIPKKI